MGRVISFVSGKGGVGKSVMCAGIGSALAEMNKSVCLIDFDFGLNNLDLMLNLEQKVVYDITDFLSGKTRLRQTLIADEHKDNLYFLSSAKVNLFEDLDPSLVKDVVDRIAGVFDYVLIDSPAGISQASRFIIEQFSEVVLVTTPNISSIRDAGNIARIIFNLNKTPKLIVNKLRPEMIDKHKSLSEIEIGRMLNLSLLGVFHEIDDISTYSSIKGVYECSVDGRDEFKGLATNLANNRAYNESISINKRHNKIRKLLDVFKWGKYESV